MRKTKFLSIIIVLMSWIGKWSKKVFIHSFLKKKWHRNWLFLQKIFDYHNGEISVKVIITVQSLLNYQNNYSEKNINYWWWFLRKVLLISYSFKISVQSVSTLSEAWVIIEKIHSI